MENVLQNINKLNRSLEGVIAVCAVWEVVMYHALRGDQVGNEFSQVEGLWSQFENVMAKEPEKEENKDAKQGASEDT